MEYGMKDNFQDWGIDCLDLFWESDNPDHIFQIEDEYEDEILRYFDMSLKSGKSLVVFCNDSFARSLSLILFFFYRRCFISTRTFI